METSLKFKQDRVKLFLHKAFDNFLTNVQTNETFLNQNSERETCSQRTQEIWETATRNDIMI